MHPTSQISTIALVLRCVAITTPVILVCACGDEPPPAPSTTVPSVDDASAQATSIVAIAPGTRMYWRDRQSTNDDQAYLLSHGYTLDLTLLAQQEALRFLRFFRAAVEAIGGSTQQSIEEFELVNHRRFQRPPKDQVEALSRYREMVRNKSQFPDDVVAIPLGSKPVPIKILPDSKQIAELSNNLINDQQESKQLAKGIYFVAGAESQNPAYPTPMPTFAFKPGGKTLKEPYFWEAIGVGKLVGPPMLVDQAASHLRIGEPQGAQLLGTVEVTALNEVLWSVSLTESNGPKSQWFAFPIADANGGTRSDRPRIDPIKGTCLENTIETSLPLLILGRHSMAKLPLPLAETGNTRGRTQSLPHYPQERIVIDERWSQLTPPVVVVRKAATWQPFVEDYVLDNRLQFNGDVPETCLITVFSNIGPSDLLRLVGALQNRDVSGFVTNPATIAKLEHARQENTPTRRPDNAQPN